MDATGEALDLEMRLAVVAGSDRGDLHHRSGSGIALSEAVENLSPGGMYRWRLRFLSDSPYFPRSRWIVHAGNGSTEMDFRTAPAAGGVGDQPAKGRFLLEANAPNPFSSTTRFAWTLPQRSRVHLAVYDVAGREVAVLLDESREPGRHATSWDGRGSHGHGMPSGVYFLRLETDSGTESRSVVLRR